MDRTDNKITVCKICFNLGASKILSQDEVDSLSDKARNIFLIYSSFWNQAQTAKFCKYLDGWR